MLGSDRMTSSSPEEEFDASSIVVSSLMNSTSSSSSTINQNTNDEMLSKLIFQQAALFQQASNISQSNQPKFEHLISDNVSSGSGNHHMLHDCFFTPTTTANTTITSSSANNATTTTTGNQIFGQSNDMSSNFDSFLLSFSSQTSTPPPNNVNNNTNNNNNNHHQQQQLLSEQQQHHQQPSNSAILPQGLLPNTNTNNNQHVTAMNLSDAMIISESFQTSSSHPQVPTGLSSTTTNTNTTKKDSNLHSLPPNNNTNNLIGSVGASQTATAAGDSSLQAYLMTAAANGSSQPSSSSQQQQNSSNTDSNNNNTTTTCNNNTSQMENDNSASQQTSDENPGSNLHPIACTRCRERHKRCDRKLPQCSYCEKQGLQCVYTTPKKQRRVYQRAVPVPAGNDVSSITMVTGGGSTGSFFTSSRTPITNPGTLNLLARRGSVDSTFSNISTATSGGISTTSSTAGTTSGSSGNEMETANAFEIFTFRWQAGGSNSQNTKTEKKRKSSCETSNVQKRNSVSKLTSPSKSHMGQADSSMQQNQDSSFENYSFPRKAKKSNKKSTPTKSVIQQHHQQHQQHQMMDNQTNNTFHPDNQTIFFNNNQNNMDAINSSISSIISQGLLMNQQKEITQDHINILGTSNPNVPTMLMNLDNNMLFGNQNMSFASTQNIVMNASIFRKAYFDFYFRYISLGYSWVPQEVFDSVLFGTEAMSSVFGNDIMSLLYAIHAITALVMGNSVEADMAYHKSELLLPPLPDNSLTSLLNNGSLTINSTNSVARNLVLAHYLLSVGNLAGSKRYLRLADGVLTKYSPNYMSQTYINCMASSDEEDAGGLTHENSVFAKVPNQIMLLMKYRVYVGFKYDEIQFIMDRGLDYVNGLVNFTQPVQARNQPLNSVCLPDDCTISFRSFVGMTMLTSYLHATGTIPNEIITITTQPLSSENIKIYLTLSLLLRKKIKGQTKARMQMYTGNQEAVLASPLSLLIDLFSLSCSILMLHETMCNQGLYQSSTTDQLQYTSVMFQYADQMKDIISQIPTESIDVSYMYLGILYLLVMYFKQLEEIENQAISKGFSLHNNDIFHKQLASLSIVHKFVAVITNKYPVVMDKYKSTVERIGLFLNKYQIMNYQ
ncbi:GAL4 domain-containing protein [Naegleria gruberi]|uniref:GAL4 domain-containing protein n=1 Tax=Naegleria gruberi TaxID=5762 RepID=D2VTU3_NAEGR|nr:GAL4 domain-containing protein [Naegleria gruberi]EFC39787.1 GAL4 domain-containing protein [Naegleria gruberi]|eukprot:XP_002672531.1 GAL4 domain-containing protein [Naegleria gruberi strain NEG-M]